MYMYVHSAQGLVLAFMCLSQRSPTSAHTMFIHDTAQLRGHSSRKHHQKSGRSSSTSDEESTQVKKKSKRVEVDAPSGEGKDETVLVLIWSANVHVYMLIHVDVA